MDLLKLLTSLEDLVVEIALWIILLPRTLFAVVFTPVTLARHFDEVQVTPAVERDDRYLTPVLFWILLAPSSLIIAISRTDVCAIGIYGDTWQERLATGILMLLGPPVGFALASILVRREGVSRKSVRRHFPLQCYFHAPMAVLFALLMVLEIYLRPKVSEDVRNALMLAVFFPAIAWFLITQYRVARRETDPVRSGGSVALGCSLGPLLFVATVFVVGTIYYLTGRAPDVFSTSSPQICKERPR